MTIWCKHVHRLELQKFLFFCAAHSPARLDIQTKFLISNYWQPCQKLKIRCSVPGLGGLKETKNVSSPSTWKSQYCGEPPWPKGSVLGLRPPGLEFRILCLEDSVISVISPSSGGSPGPVYPICAQRWPKARFISFHFKMSLHDLGNTTDFGWWYGEYQAHFNVKSGIKTLNGKWWFQVGSFFW